MPVAISPIVRSDFYLLLGVNRECTSEQLRRAFQRLAVHYHPDKTESNVDFLAVCEAYYILSNKKLRAVYNFYGRKGLETGVKSNLDDDHYEGGFKFTLEDAHKLFLEFFGTADPYEAQFVPVTLEATQTPLSRPTEYVVLITLEELYSGTVKILNIVRRDARGSESGKDFRLDIRPGMRNKSRFVFPNQGDFNTHTGKPSDMVLILHQQPHSKFQRIGDDLYYKVRVSLGESVYGVHVEVRTLDDRLLQFWIQDVVHPEYKYVVDDEGMPNAEGRKGRLILYFEIEYPKQLPLGTREALKKLLP